jgi:hypothetical protein
MDWGISGLFLEVQDISSKNLVSWEGFAAYSCWCGRGRIHFLMVGGKF